MHSFSYHIEQQHDGTNIGTYLRRTQGFSRELVKRIKRSGEVTVNGEPRPLWHKLAAGDTLHVSVEEEREQLLEPQQIPFEILFEDESLLVVNKPAGLVVHPTKGVADGTLANGVVHHWMQQGESRIFRPVNRLDRDTSGIVVVAKNSYVQERLIQQSRKDEWQKYYTAVVQGVLPTRTGVIDAPIARVGNGSRARTVSADGKPSRTLWKLLQGFDAASLVEAQLITGRTHQIRVHFAHIGHPLLGDDLYGKPSTLIPRQALHASRLSFIHPVEKTPMELEAPLPEDMRLL
ncbi:MAG: RluA family pseudouridine synthase, partial [Bacillota bacterium]